MSMALSHFAFGAGMTTLVVTLLVPTVWFTRTLILAGGGWAMLPDLHWVSPIATQQLYQWHRTSVWTDLFWLHRTWDRVDPTDSTATAAGLVVFLLLATAIAEYRNYRAPLVVESAYQSYIDADPNDRE